MASNTSRDFFFKKLPGLVLRHFSIHTPITSVFIHPFLLQKTATPDGNFSRGIVILLKMTIGFNFSPAAMQARTTSSRVRSSKSPQSLHQPEPPIALQE